MATTPPHARGTRLLAMAALWLALVAPGTAHGPPGDHDPHRERLSHGRFENAQLYRPRGEVRQVVLFLSGDGGWDGAMDRMAQALATEGALVVGISTPPLLKSFSADGGTCVYPDGDLENLARWIQGYARLPTYFRPLLVGYASGAALAYAALARAPADTFGGALSLAFAPHLAMDLPPCGGEAATLPRPVRGRGIELTPAATVRAPWIVLQGESDRVCPAATAATFVARVHGATLVRVPHGSHVVAADGHWMPSFLAAYRTLAVPATASVPPPPAALSDLPLVEVAATGNDPRFAVLLSGDGGWAGLDKDVADALATRGIPVAGWDSLRYFWTARTPEDLAADLDRVLRFYAAQWRRSRALVIGYSQGADVLPFALNRLPPASRALVAQTVLLNLGQNASFEFHVGNWIGNDDTSGLPIRPEAEKLHAATTLCVYGEDETDSLCPRLGDAVRPLMLPGGHHFDGDYARLAETILRSASPAASPTPHARGRMPARRPPRH